MSTHGRGKYEHKGAVEEYEDRFLVCRDVGHHWQADPHWGASYKGDRIIEYRRTLTCRHCGGERRDTYDARMRKVATYYSHADGYLTHKNAPKIDRSTARMEQVRRYGLDLAPRRLRKMGGQQ